MLNRRIVIAAAAALMGLVGASAALAQKAPKELTFAVIPVENATVTSERFGPLADYLGKQIGIPVKLRIANDYAAVIEAQRAGNAQIAWYGPASYVQAVRTGVKTEPMAMQKHATGVAGYYSVLWVKAESPYKSVEDLKGKTIALVDPNSTSGNNAPRYLLSHDKHIDNLDAYFGKVTYAGSHQNALMALAQGTADVAANEYFSETDSQVTRMAEKHLLKDASGKELGAADFRVIYKSPLLPEGPFAVLESLDPKLRAKIKQAFLDLPKKDKKVFDGLSNGKDLDIVPSTRKDYEPIFGIVEYVDSMRKKQQ